MKVGNCFSLFEQDYHCVRFETVIRTRFSYDQALKQRVAKGTTPVRLGIWRSACADCGAPFEFSTALNFPVGCTGLLRRCVAHRRKGRRVRTGAANFSDERGAVLDYLFALATGMIAAGLRVTPAMLQRQLRARDVPEELREGLKLSADNSRLQIHCGQLLLDLHRQGRMRKSEGNIRAPWVPM